MRRVIGRVGLEGRATALASRALGASAPLALALTERVGDLVDATSSRLLSSDEAAAQLAFFVESIARDVERERVVAAVLQHNLLLDGTFLGLIRPMLAGGDSLDSDPRALDAASDTIVTLLEVLVRLHAGESPDATRGPEAGDAASASATRAERLDRLAEAAPGLPTDALRPFLVGERPPPEIAGFVLTSYSLFLQTFLLRSTVHMAPRLLSGRLLED